jgi:hypothetical protein
VDCVKKFLDLFLATALVGIDSKKRHCVLLLPKKLAGCLEDWKGFVTRRRSQQVSIQAGRRSERRWLRMDLLRNR